MSFRPRSCSTPVAASAPRSRLDEVLSVGLSLGALGLKKGPVSMPTEVKRKRDPPVMPKFTQYKKSVDPSDIFSHDGRFYEQDPSGVPLAVAKNSSSVSATNAWDLVRPSRVTGLHRGRPRTMRWVSEPT